MSLDDFDLLVNSVHRTWVQDTNAERKFSSANVKVQGDSIFLLNTHIFEANDAYWITLTHSSGSKVEYEVKRPHGFFNRSERQRYDKLIAILSEVKSGYHTSSAEELICQNIDCAKDIIAERSLVEDDGD